MSDPRHPYATPESMKPGGATAGLRNALARKNDGKASTKAFAGLSTDQLLAGLDDGQKAALVAKIQPTPPTPSDVRAKAVKDANERLAKVCASEHYAGREKLAANLLAIDHLSADEIVTYLAVAPSPKAIDPQRDADAEQEAARADLRAKLAANSGEQAEAEERSLADAMRARWDGIHAEVAEERGHGAR